MSGRVGVVLAGGRATRLPNKPLLPLRGGDPVIMSSVRFLSTCGLDAIFVVVPPGSVIIDVVSSLTTAATFVEQEEATGVPNAISCAHRTAVADMLVCCCDNIFPDEEPAPRIDGVTVARQQVRECPPWQAMHLSRRSEDRWIERGTRGSCVAGWLWLPRQLAATADHFANTTDFLNAIGAEPEPSEHAGWYDVGVTDSYARYWRAK